MIRNLCLAAATLIGLGMSADAASLWEATPYRLRVWIGCEPRPELGSGFVDWISNGIERRAQSVVGPAWQVEAAAAPAEFVRAITRLEELAVEPLQASEPDALQSDKLVLVRVGRDSDGYAVDAWELDLATQQWGARVRREARHRALLPAAAVDAMAACFKPLGRIEVVSEGTARVVLKASSLAEDPSPVLLGAGAVLQPISRRNDRLGRPQSGGIRVVPWTLLEVRADESGSLACAIHSGLRRPLRGRGSYRTKQLALAVAAGAEATRLLFRSRSEPDKPLAGYEVFSRPDPEAETQLLGETDADGSILVSPSDKAFRLLYIKSGARLLARLPLVPGRKRQVTVLLPDDEARLDVEAFLAGIDNRLTDVTVKRALLAAQLRNHLGGGEVAEAAEVLEAFRRLPAAVQLNDDLQRKRSQLEVSDAAALSAIDALFRSTREKITKYLDPQLDRTLAEELEKAKSAAGSE